MRVSLFALILVSGITFTTAQEKDELPALDNPHNYIKLLAQDAALPALQGEEKFILRESWWSGRMEPGKAKLIQVQLFRRNAYQFWLAVPNRNGEPIINVYDSEGNLIPSESLNFEGTNIVSTMIQPEITGVYYIRVSLKTTIESPQDWAVIYAYR
ncbi:MAG: hypothetical protein P1U58_15725 [Verrucomicrobiales bacterium]|nr:hypothetical protein [Verrucomicrobiales bacterium]